MKYTTNYNLKKPDGVDPVNIQELNDNFDSLDIQLNKKLDKSGSASDMSAEFIQATNRENINKGDKLSTIFSKIMKWYADMKEAAYKGVVNDLITEAEGFVLDARQGKNLKDTIDLQSGNLSNSIEEMKRDLGGIGSYTILANIPSNFSWGNITIDSITKYRAIILAVTGTSNELGATLRTEYVPTEILKTVYNNNLNRILCYYSNEYQLNLYYINDTTLAVSTSSGAFCRVYGVK